MRGNILFVCTGNTCRSPMAEALFRMLLKEEGYLGKYTCSSAGVYAYEGDNASFEAIKTLKKFGLDIARHYAKTLNLEMIRKADLIFTMTGEQKRMLLEVYPEAIDKVFTLKEYAEYEPADWDIPDPFGFDLETYERCAEELETVLLRILDRL